MRLLEKNTKLIYHSKRNIDEDNDMVYFDVPVGLKANPMPLSVDWTRAESGQYTTGMLKFFISRDAIRNAIVFNPYGYDRDIYGFDESNPYAWVDEYLTYWINGGVSEGDLFYVNEEPSTEYAQFVQGKNADYAVFGIEDTPNYLGVILKRLT